jgi:thiaminase
VGGVWGYSEFLKAINDPRHEEHENYKEWISGHPCYHGTYDSERFDSDTVNFELLKYLRWSRQRAKFWHSVW